MTQRQKAQVGVLLFGVAGIGLFLHVAATGHAFYGALAEKG